MGGADQEKYLALPFLKRSALPYLIIPREMRLPRSGLKWWPPMSKPGQGIESRVAIYTTRLKPLSVGTLNRFDADNPAAGASLEEGLVLASPHRRRGPL